MVSKEKGWMDVFSNAIYGVNISIILLIKFYIIKRKWQEEIDDMNFHNRFNYDESKKAYMGNINSI